MKNNSNTWREFDRIVRKFFTPDTKIGILRYFISFVGVVLFGAAMVAWQGENPLHAASLILEGAFGNKVSIGNTLRWATPCMLTGAAAIIASKSGVVNLGIEGQMYVGALAAALLGWLVPMPESVHPIACILISGLAGVMWVILPAFLRLFFSIDEYVSTMMMNYIATLLCEFIVLTIIRLKGVTKLTVQTENILDSAKLTTLVPGTAAKSGFLIGLVVCILVYLLYKYTIVGYELKQVGENLKFAKTGGVNVKKTFISIFVISGFIGGVVGGVEVTGGYYRYVANFAGSMGWEGIMIANICNGNPIAPIFVSLVWGALKTGAMNMERGTSINRLTVNLMQMVFVLLVSIDYEGIVKSIKDAKAKRIARKRLESGQEV